MTTNINDRGSRLLVTLIDKYAVESPQRVWAAFPVDDSDLSKGFKDITYENLSNAINHAVVWLQQNLAPATTSFETIAYAGPKDIRYPILSVAAAKVGRKLLLPSPFASNAAQAHLLTVSECRAYLYAPPARSKVEQVLSNVEHSQPTSLEVPDLSAWLTEEKAPPAIFENTWESAKNDPWLIFHTSGTTGFPKLITYTHRMMASLDTERLMPDADTNNMVHQFEYKRWYTPLPSVHVVGMIVSLQFTVFLHSILVVGPATPGPPSPRLVSDIIKHGNVEEAMLPPSFIDAACRDPEALHSLRNLDYLYFTGAPLVRETAEQLLGHHVSVKPAMGSTEAGVYFLRLDEETDWEYYRFRPAMGLEMRPVAKRLYEAVFVRRKELERWQQVFMAYPELEEFGTKDLFVEHPEKEGFWKYVGRTDDLVVLAHGESVHAKALEDVLSTSEGVGAVLVGGQSRPCPFVIVEWKDGASENADRLAEFWDVLERANESCSEVVKLRREFVVFASPEKPLIRTAKGSVGRRESERLYAEEIEQRFKVHWK